MAVVVSVRGKRNGVICLQWGSFVEDWSQLNLSSVPTTSLDVFYYIFR